MGRPLFNHKEVCMIFNIVPQTLYQWRNQNNEIVQVLNAQKPSPRKIFYEYENVISAYKLYKEARNLTRGVDEAIAKANEIINIKLQANKLQEEYELSRQGTIN